MLKACWDCIAGYDLNSDRTANEDPYGTQMHLLNGGTLRAPPWPESIDNENMFVLPKKLNAGDKISIHGSMFRSPKLMTVSLITGSDVPDKSNVACQLDVNFQSDSNEIFDQIFIKTVENGTDEILNQSLPKTGYFSGDDFTIHFVANENEYLTIFIEASYLDQIKLKHNIGNIRFLAVSGDVEKVKNLEFKFS